MFVYYKSFKLLLEDDISYSKMLFFSFDFSGYVIISQLISTIILFIYSLKEKKYFIFFLFLVIVYSLFDYFLNYSTILFNPH